MTSIDSVAQFVASQDRREGAKIAGRWHNLQIKPDLGSSEILNVGVAFVDEARNVHLKLARDLSRLTCLYDDRIDVRSFERLCTVIEGAYNGSALDAFNLAELSPQASLSAGRYASGSSIGEILNTFFSATVPLAQPRMERATSVRQPRARSISTADAQQRVIEHLISRMGVRAVPYIAQTPWVVTEDGRERKIDVPIRSAGRLCASVVSVWSKDEYRRKFQLAKAGLDLDTVQAHNPGERLGLFVMRPMEEQGYSKAELEDIDGEIDEAAWQLRKLANIEVEQGEDASELSGKLEDWLKAA